MTTSSHSRRTLLKGSAIALPLVALGGGIAHAGSVEEPPNPNPNPNPPMPGCTDDKWRYEIPCAHFTDQSNGEGFNWGSSTSLTLYGADAGPAGYDIQCYLVPVVDNYTRNNCHGNASARFQSITAGSGCSRGFFAGHWSYPKDASGIKLPHCFDGAGGDKHGSNIVLPSGSIMVQANGICFPSFTGSGTIRLNLKNRWFSHGQNWVKAIWVIKNNAMGHWHVLDTVRLAGAGKINRYYDGIF